MQEATQISEQILKNEGAILADEIYDMAKNLPGQKISELAIRLRLSVASLNMYLDTCFQCKNKMDRIRAWIKVSVALKECRDTLALIAKYRYANTSNVMTLVDNMSQMLNYSRQNLN